MRTALLCALLIVAAPAFAQYYYSAPAGGDNSQQPLLRTVGKGTVYTDPDSVRVIFGIETTDRDLSAARRANESRTQQLLKALAALPIPEVRVKTLDAAVRTIPEWREDTRKIEGYRMRSQLTALATGKREQLGQWATRLADTGLANGANALIDVIFFLSDSSRAEREAISRATQNAKANAEALAAAMGVRIKQYGTVTCHPQRDYYYHWSSYWGWGGDYSGMRQVMQVSDAASATQMVAGQLEVTVTVNLAAVYE